MEVEVDDDTGEIMDGRHVRPFAEWMLEQRTGALAAELSEGLNGLVGTRTGELTLKVTVKPANRGSGIVLVFDEVKVKLPVPDKEANTFFVDKDGNLTRDNPHQSRLPLREVPPPAQKATDQAKEAATQ